MNKASKFTSMKRKNGEDYVRSDRKSFLGIKANPPVFIISLLIIVTLVVSTIVVGKPIENWFSSVQNYISDKFGWYFILVSNFFLIFILVVGFGRFGKIRLGGQKAKAEFKLSSWFAMLFSAGMGIGLLFYGVAEPITHYTNNPFGLEGIEAAKSSMTITFLHWGFHGWAIYAIVGLSLAYFAFNKKLPLTIRSAFFPVLGNKIYGKIGDSIDIISVIATLFGLATSLGLGAKQVNAGLHYLFDLNFSINWQITIIIIVTFLATISLVLGLDKGIRRLSEINMKLAITLLLFVLALGPTLFLLDSFIENVGFYLSNLVEYATWTESYSGISKEGHWQNSWTIFYWGWWIAWAPFVGIFIARISKGRTIKEFILGVLLVPSLLTFLWISVFGGSAFYQELLGNTEISEAVTENVATAIYHLLEQYPLPFISSFFSILLVASFFITSSDSGSMVVDTLTSGGKLDAPVGQKVFWASMEGLVAIVLLLGGGLVALQTANLLCALPFSIILLVMCYSLLKALRHDHRCE